MKYFSIVISAYFSIFLILLFSPESMAFMPDDFQYSAKIPGPIKMNTLYKIHITEEIFRKSDPGFRDLRILDQRNNEIPYVILTAEYPKRKIQNYSLKIKEFKNRASDIFITVELPNEASNLNSLELNIQNRDFSKIIQIEGSSNRKKWIPVASDWIYDFTSQVDLRKTTINFEAASFRYYRLTIRDVTLGEEKSKTMDLQYNGLHFNFKESIPSRKFRINSVTGSFVFLSENRNEYDEHTFKDFTESRDKDGNSIMLVVAGLPAQTITLMIQNPYFYRNIKIYNSNTDENDESWLFKGNYSVFKFNFEGLNDPQTSMEILSEPYKYYKFFIENKNSTGLKIDEIQFKWPRYYLYFVGLEKGASYALHFGSPLIHSAPQYDLARLVRKDNWPNLQTTVLRLSQLDKNQQYNPVFPKKQGDIWEKRILYVVVFFGVFTMGIWVYQLLRENSPKNI